MKRTITKIEIDKKSGLADITLDTPDENGVYGFCIDSRDTKGWEIGDFFIVQKSGTHIFYKKNVFIPEIQEWDILPKKEVH